MAYDVQTIEDGSKTWVENLHHYVTQHVQIEQGLLENYISAAQGSDSKALRYLVNLIIQDEKRHHQMFGEFAAALEHGLNWTSGDAEIPAMDFYKVDSDKLQVVTDLLLENEMNDLKDLKYLHKMVKHASDATLWDLIIQTMQRDTEKHIAILSFIKSHLHD